MSETQFMLLLKVEAMSAKATVNGVPLQLREGPQTRVTAKELSAFVNAGTNTVKVDLGAGSRTGAYRIAVFSKAQGGAATEVASAQGTAATTETLRFAGPGGAGPEAGGLEGDADHVVSTEAKTAITTLLTRMRAAIMNGSADQLMPLLHEKIARHSSAVGETVAGATATQRATVDALIEHRDVLTPFRPGALNFHAVRDGQEVIVCHSDGAGPIVAELEGATISMRPSFAEVGGEWMVVR